VKRFSWLSQADIRRLRKTADYHAVNQTLVNKHGDRGLDLLIIKAKKWNRLLICSNHLEDASNSDVKGVPSHCAVQWHHSNHDVSS